jgi:hypothetical protein
MKKRDLFLIFAVLSLCTNLFSRENIGRFQEKRSPVYRGYNPSQEIVEARTPNTKVFRTDGGYFVYRIFTHPVHYISDRGILEDYSSNVLCCLDWNVNESYSGYIDGIFEEKNVCGQTATYIQVNDTWLYRGFVEFNTDAIPDTALIDTVILHLNCIQWPIYNEDHDIWSMESRPSTAAPLTVYDDAGNGTCYVGGYLGNTGWNSWDLGDQGAQDLENKLPDDWFAIGISGFYSASAYYLLYQCGTGYLDVIEEVTGIEEYAKESSTCIISHNYPNPFSFSTTITLFGIPEDQYTRAPEIQIFDVVGRKIKSLSVLSSQFTVPSYVWDGRDDAGNTVPTGTYFYQIRIVLIARRRL